MSKETKFRVIFCLCIFVFSFLWPSARAIAQDRASADPTIPVELTPADPEIRALLAYESCKPNGAAWTEKLENALQMANSRGLVGDRALIEASLASAVFVQGNAEQALLLFQKALQDSIDAKRQVLEADILISLSSEAQMKGDASERPILSIGHSPWPRRVETSTEKQERLASWENLNSKAEKITKPQV